MVVPGSRRIKVGLFLPTAKNPFTHHMPGWDELLSIVRTAEDIGFDSVYVGDHLIMRFDPSEPIGVWESCSLISAIAASTKTMQLGLLMSCTSFRNPALLAKMAATIDEISGGRFSLGLGAGWHQPEFEAFGYPFDHRVDRFEEAVTIATTLLREGGIDFDGRYHQLRDCELLPRGPRPGGLPIVMGGKGPRMLRLAATYADIWNRDFAPEGSIADLPTWKERVDAACEDVKRDPATLGRTAAVTIDMPGCMEARQDWNALSGNPEELAQSLHAYADAGFSEVQVWLEPATLAGLEAFAPTLEFIC
jgi:alkanesulfonate monooxygenase SsuD/methylene tetrahydromethanopterin reductase-like flavin-dependent oxidoreductase (luciferase family)